LPKRGKREQEVLVNCGPQSIGPVENLKMLTMIARRGDLFGSSDYLS
jgi:hypothetical protein